MQFNEAITTTTRNRIVPKCYDTVTKGSPLLLTVLQNAKEWNSGLQYETVIKYQDTTNGGLVGIADKLDTDRQNTRTKMTFDPKTATKPLVIANIELILNQGDERVLDIFQTEFDSQAQSLSMLMASQLMGGTGVGNSWDSLFNAADDGTNFSTYGGKSRSTYPTIKGYYLASTGAITLAKLATADDATTVGTAGANMIVTTKSIWSTYESLLNTSVVANYTTSGYPMMNAFGMVQGTKGLQGNAGFSVLFFRGKPVVKDEQVASGKVFFINSDFFGMKGISLAGVSGMKQLNIKKTSDAVPGGVIGNVPSTRGFNFRDLMSPVDQLAEVGHLIYSGNFVSENPRLQGSMVGAS